MQFNFSVPMKLLSGEESKVNDTPVLLSDLLAQCLVNQPKGNSVKFYGWAIDLHAGKILHLDKADQKTLQEFIENSEYLTVLSKAQMLLILDAGKE